MSAMEITSQVFHYLGKALGIGGAGHKIYTRVKQEKLTSLDKLDLVAQGVFITMTGVTVGLTEIPGQEPVSQGAGIGIHAAQGVADMTRHITEKKADQTKWTSADTLNFLGVFGLSTGDVIGFTCEHYPNILHGHLQEVELVGTFSGTLGSAARNRKLIIEGKKAFILVGKKLLRINKREGEIKSAAAAKSPLSEEEQKVSHAILMDINTFREAFRKDPKSCTVIPDCIADSCSDFTCPISQRPIRFIYVPNLSEEIMSKYPELQTLCYEAKALEVWLNNNPKKAPPGWPEGLTPPELSAFKADLRCQGAIDKKIESLLTLFF